MLATMRAPAPRMGSPGASAAAGAVAVDGAVVAAAPLPAGGAAMVSADGAAAAWTEADWCSASRL